MTSSEMPNSYRTGGGGPMQIWINVKESIEMPERAKDHWNLEYKRNIKKIAAVYLPMRVQKWVGNLKSSDCECEIVSYDGKVFMTLEKC